MSRSFYSKHDIIDIYLKESEEFELALFKDKKQQPYFFKAKFLWFDEEQDELYYQVQGNPEKWVKVNDIIGIGKDYNYNTD